MEDKQVILQRKQSTPFTVYYPYGMNGMHQEIVWMGTTGKHINERPVSMEVFLWLKEKTTTFQSGALVIKPTEDEDINYEKENIEDIEQAEQSALTKEEIQKILETGNQNVLKKALTEMTKDKNENLAREIKRQVMLVASEIGIDSSAKRKVICDWVGLDFENSDLLFDKNIENLHK
jgi:hypothetical protein